MNTYSRSYAKTLIALFFLMQLHLLSNAMAATTTFESALKTHLTAIEKRDWLAFEATLTNSKTLTFIAPSGKLSTATADFKRQMQAWFADKDWSWQLTLMSQESSQNMGTAIYRVIYNDLDQQGKPIVLQYLLTLVFAKEATGWKLVHDQNTLVAK
jgi:ketosteroid isomerase-like protein